MKTTSILKYSSDILPKNIDKSIIVESIGTIALGNDYKVEKLTATLLYKITKT